MREPTGAARVRDLMERLGAESRGPGRIYLVGGASAVLLDWRATTVDVEAMGRRRLIEPARLIELFGAIEPALIRYPAIDPASLRDRVLSAAKEMAP